MEGGEKGESISGVTTLWREIEDMGVSRNLRPSSLGVYREIPSLSFHSGGSLSSQQLAVERTVHICKEIANVTENKIEQHFLKTKTMVTLQS